MNLTEPLVFTSLHLRRTVLVAVGFWALVVGSSAARDVRWLHQVESSIEEHSEATFRHGLCPECSKTYFPGTEPRRFDTP